VFVQELTIEAAATEPPIAATPRGPRLLFIDNTAPLFKFALLTIVACIASFAFSAAVFRRTPVLRAIL